MKNYRSLIVSLCVMSFLTGIIYKSIGLKSIGESVTIDAAIEMTLLIWFLWYIGFDAGRRINQK